MLSRWMQHDLSHRDRRRVPARLYVDNRRDGGAGPHRDNNGAGDGSPGGTGVQCGPDRALCVRPVDGCLAKVGARGSDTHGVFACRLWPVVSRFQLHHDARVGVSVFPEQGVNERRDARLCAPHPDLGLHNLQAGGLEGVDDGACPPVPFAVFLVRRARGAACNVAQFIVHAATDFERRPAPPARGCCH